MQAKHGVDRSDPRLGIQMNNSVKILLLVIWIVVIFVLTGYPTLRPPQIANFPTDKLYHFIIFFVLAFLERPLLKPLHFILLGIGVAVVAEAQQLIVPGRDRSEEHTSELQSRLHLVC